MAPIIIRKNALDPASPGDVQLPPDASKTNYVLVQLQDEMTPETVTAIQDKGASIVKRMDNNTWLLNYPPYNLSLLESVPAVEHALVYVDHFVVDADLKQGTSTEVAEQEPLVSIMLHEAVESSDQSVLAEIQSFASPEVELVSRGVLHLKVNQQHLERIAALDSVQAIEKVTKIEPINDQIKTVTSVDAANEAILTARQTGLTGTGQVVAIADSGIDATHDAFKSTNKIVAQLSFRPKPGADDTLGHGTHVAGTVAGLPVKDWAGHDITGVAPNAQVAVLAAIGVVPSTSVPSAWYTEARNNVAGVCRISNNSWGNRVESTQTKQSPYGADNAEKLDEWALQNPDFLLVFAAGNDGRFSTLNMPDLAAQVQTWATAKNVLTIGATYTERPTKKGPDADGGFDQADYSQANLNSFKSKRGTIAPFSSRGPVINTKRTKPDIVAPGVCILSARSGSTDPAVQVNLNLWIRLFGTFPGGGNVTDKLTIASGTSMAAPAVSGCAALLREALARWKNLSNPSAPLLKALLINGADNLGISASEQGFGQINMSRTLKPVGLPGQRVTEINGSGYAQGTAEAKDLTAPITPFKTTVPSPSANNKNVNFVATLVYHDAKGEQIQNKMNLSVTYANKVTETFTTASNENVHRVILNTVSPGQIISIGVQPKLIAITGSTIPWGLAWDHFEL